MSSVLKHSAHNEHDGIVPVSEQVNKTSEKVLPLNHEGETIDAGYRLDLLVDDCIIVELKATEAVLPIHQAQLMTYLKLSGVRLGLLLNFNCKLMKEGIKRIVM